MFSIFQVSLFCFVQGLHGFPSDLFNMLQFLRGSRWMGLYTFHGMSCFVCVCVCVCPISSEVKWKTVFVSFLTVPLSPKFRHLIARYLHSHPDKCCEGRWLGVFVQLVNLVTSPIVEDNWWVKIESISNLFWGCGCHLAHHACKAGFAKGHVGLWLPSTNGMSHVVLFDSSLDATLAPSSGLPNGFWVLNYLHQA